jgi:hypothetical protein
LAGGAQAKLGQGLVWLGDKLGWRRLAAMGAAMAASGMRMAPRLSEELLGRQEAALRELLRQFREGNTDQALRRALPLGDPAARGGRMAGDASLPFHNLLYRLGELLGAGGPGGVWMASNDVYRDLESAYRRAAEEATRRGDFRRAAFIYGKLLRDWRLAAGVLSRGGLHHDAAILFLEKAGDAHAAAREFEAAGEVDRALFLYRQRGEHVLAGDLLMRAGESEQAVEEYGLAADREAAQGRYLAAADLLIGRARRSDLAEKHLVRGWEQRPRGEAPGCLLRLAELYANRSTPAPLLKLTAEADEYFAGPGNDRHAGDFYNRLVKLSDSEKLAAVRDELHDRALRGLAGKLRRSAPAGDQGRIVSCLFGNSGVWPAELVRDAAFALRARPREASSKHEVSRVVTHRGKVTAACAAGETGDLFLGFEDATLVHFNPRSGAVALRRTGGAIGALAVDAGARALVFVQLGRAGEELVSYQALGAGYVQHTWRRMTQGAALARLTPIARGRDGLSVGLWDGEELTELGVPDLLPVGRVKSGPSFQAALLPDGLGAAKSPAELVIFEEGRVLLGREEEPGLASLGLYPFSPAAVTRGGQPLLSWLAPTGTQFEVAFTEAGGVLHWLSLRFFTTDPGVLAHHRMHGGTHYLCTTLLRPGRLAGVHAGGVAWLSGGERGFLFHARTEVELDDAVACFASPPTNELLVVTARGDVVRVPAPA